LSYFVEHGTATQDDVSLLLAPSDHGVQRNGGRAGARWAPATILNVLKKLAAPENAPKLCLNVVTLFQKETVAYEKMLEQEAQLIRSALNARAVVHIGGGHDHVLPLMQALTPNPIAVLNIDAHLDTRIDREIHSGNPFRQFSEIGDLQLHQIGIHPFANSTSTQTALTKGEMHILWRNQCDEEALVQAFLMRFESQLQSNTKIVFSLDCDALMASDVEAVSDPNHNGLTLEFVRKLAKHYRDLCERRSQTPIWGIYEFNPLYDSVSSKSARAVAGLIYDMLF